MNITEASAVATALCAVTGHGHQPTATDLALAMHRLDERAAKALQLSRIVPDVDIEDAARDLEQRSADRLGA